MNATGTSIPARDGAAFTLAELPACPLRAMMAALLPLAADGRLHYAADRAALYHAALGALREAGCLPAGASEAFRSYCRLVHYWRSRPFDEDRDPAYGAIVALERVLERRVSNAPVRGPRDIAAKLALMRLGMREEGDDRYLSAVVSLQRALPHAA